MPAARPRLRILLGEAIAMGPGRADLLEAIDRSGSISAAARELHMSYRRAWQLVDAMNQSFTEPLVDTSTGGRGGGGARLTGLGREVIARYRAMEERATEAVRLDLEDFLQFLRDRGR